MRKTGDQILFPRCSDKEWETRVQLAGCYRAFVFYGWTDSIFTHLSARVPGEPNHYLINPHGLLTIGRSVAEAFYYLYSVESACKVQVDVLACQQGYLTPDPAVVDEQAWHGKQHGVESHGYVDMAWDAVLRLLDKTDPSFRN